MTCCLKNRVEGDVLIHSDPKTKNTINWVTDKQKLLSHSSKGWELQDRGVHQQIKYLVRGPSLVHSSTPGVIIWFQGLKELSGVSLLGH